MSKKYITNEINDSINVKNDILKDNQLLELIDVVAEHVTTAFKNKNKILIAGNGGSAADSQHLAAEFVSRFNFDRASLNAIALTTDTSIITSIGNDYDFDQIFSRQIESHGSKGDIFLAISTSGNSKNILKALEIAKLKKLITVGLTGFDGGKMNSLTDFCLRIPSKETPRIQESHIMIEHIICGRVEEMLFRTNIK